MGLTTKCTKKTKNESYLPELRIPKSVCVEGEGIPLISPPSSTVRALETADGG